MEGGSWAEPKSSVEVRYRAVLLLSMLGRRDSFLAVRKDLQFQRDVKQCFT